MSDPPTTLASGAAAILGRALTRQESESFDKYLNLLAKWQKTVRLAGRSNPGWIVENLFLDSLIFLRALPPRFDSVLDLGAGAGLPGIPIKIVRPETILTLVEARRRRASFLAAVVRELALVGVEVVNSRAEDVADRFAGQLDVVVMRCAGTLTALVPLAARLVKPTGRVVIAGPPRLGPPELPSLESIEVPGIAEVRSGSPRRFFIARGSGRRFDDEHGE